MLPGTRVLVFDSLLFVDDVTTPLSVTMQPATVVCRYGKMKARIGDSIFGPYPDLVDVKFDGRGRVSHGHFAESVRLLDEQKS